MNTRYEDHPNDSQEGHEQRCTAPHPIIPFLFFLGTLLAVLAIVFTIIAFFR